MIPRQLFGPRQGETMSDFVDMPGFVPGPDRDALGFESGVKNHFAFLEDRGYRIVQTLSTYVRYERGPLFVNVYHGRGSYELGVELGRRVHRDGESVDQSYSIRYLAGVIGGAARDSYRTRFASTAAQVTRFVAELGHWLESHGQLALEGDEATFEALSEAMADESSRLIDSMRVTKLRRRANVAWRAGDYAAVVLAYEEIDRELPTVQLRRFEAGRLEYAKKRIEY